MSRVPPSWKRASLREVCDIVSGATPKTGVADFWGGDIAWVTPNDLSKDRSQTIVHGERQLTRTGYESCSARTFPAGSVIVSSRAPIGYVAIAGQEMCTNQGCKTAVPPDFIDSKYLYWYMLNARADLESRASGTTFKEISGKGFGETQLVWPELDEQRQIVDILEDHLSRLDAGARGLGEAVERIRLLKVSSLVRNVRSHEETKTDSLMFGDEALALAPGWTSGCVAQVADFVEYGTSSKAHKEQRPGDVPVLRMGNVKDGRLVWGSLKYLSSDHPGVQKLMLLPGDLLFNRTNSAEHVGKSAVFEGERELATFASYLIRVRFRPDVDPRWVNMVINSPYGRAYVTSVTSQQVGQANVNGTKLKGFPIPIPPLGEQMARIKCHAETVDRTDRLFTEVQTATHRLESLRRSLLAAAFSGRLTGHSTDMEMVEEMAGV
jgi:type I restriction enzyme S subunit